MELKDNVVGKINIVLLNMPDNVTDLAKIRYIYMKLGNLFSYDFKIVADENLAGLDVDYDEIARYQTCTQISKILNTILSNINKNSKAKIVSRNLNNNSRYRYSHVANEVVFTDEKTGIEYKLLLDLTLDLFRIQAGMQTMQFAYTTDEFGSYDIISTKECEEMDKELGLIDKDGYRDKKILEVKNEISKLNETLVNKIKYMWDKLSISFAGSHEVRQYFISILSTIFPYVGYHVYNLYYRDVSETQFASLFIIKDKDDKDIYFLLDNNLGLMISNKENINHMLSFGWKSNSRTLSDVIGYEPEYQKHK